MDEITKFIRDNEDFLVEIYNTYGKTNMDDFFFDYLKKKNESSDKGKVHIPNSAMIPDNMNVITSAINNMSKNNTTVSPKQLQPVQHPPQFNPQMFMRNPMMMQWIRNPQLMKMMMNLNMNMNTMNNTNMNNMNMNNMHMMNTMPMINNPIKNFPPLQQQSKISYLTLDEIIFNKNPIDFNSGSMALHLPNKINPFEKPNLVNITNTPTPIVEKEKGDQTNKKNDKKEKEKDSSIVPVLEEETEEEVEENHFFKIGKAGKPSTSLFKSKESDIPSPTIENESEISNSAPINKEISNILQFVNLIKSKNESDSNQTKLMSNPTLPKDPRIKKKGNNNKKL
jgi:hypothetical protein